MSTEQPKKRGFLSRLFGERTAPKPEPAPLASPAATVPSAGPADAAPSPAQPEDLVPAVIAEMPAERRGWFQKLRQGLTKTSSKLPTPFLKIHADAARSKSHPAKNWIFETQKPSNMDANGPRQPMAFPQVARQRLAITITSRKTARTNSP